MQPEPYRTPFLSITALAKNLAVPEIACGLAGWYPAHFRYPKPPFDNVQWLLDHAALVDDRAAARRLDGYRTAVEAENAFRVPGQISKITVAGTPDLVALKPADQHAIIEDAKTGAPRPEHVVQVRLYVMFWKFIPVARQHALPGAELTVDGLVVYRDGTTVIVPPPDNAFRQQVRDAIAALGGPVRLPATPSLAVCPFCTVPGCADRFDPESVALAANDLFD